MPGSSLKRDERGARSPQQASPVKMACQTLPGLPRAALPSGRFAQSAKDLPNVVRPCCRGAAALRGAAARPQNIFYLKFFEMGHIVRQQKMAVAYKLNHHPSIRSRIFTNKNLRRASRCDRPRQHSKRMEKRPALNY